MPQWRFAPRLRLVAKSNCLTLQEQYRLAWMVDHSLKIQDIIFHLMFRCRNKILIIYLRPNRRTVYSSNSTIRKVPLIWFIQKRTNYLRHLQYIILYFQLPRLIIVFYYRFYWQDMIILISSRTKRNANVLVKRYWYVFLW